MAVVWNSVRRGPRAVALPFAILSQAKQLADRCGTISVPQSDSVKAPATDRFIPVELMSSCSGSCGPYSSRRRSLFIDAISEQVALQNLSGSEEGISVLTLNRPEAKNAIGVEMLSKLRASLENLQFHTSARILIICSTVPGVFCAGADLKERRKMGVAEAQKFVHTLRSTFNALETLPIPTIAAVEGAALGGGLELALACDLRVCGDEAVFGLPETGLAIIPGAGGTQRLPRILGRARAKELIYTGRRITGEQAETIGLVNHCVLAGNAYQKAVEIAQEITKQGPLAVKLAKVAIDRGSEIDTSSGMIIEEACYAQVLKSKDRLEGLAAFAEKRKPCYTDEDQESLTCVTDANEPADYRIVSAPGQRRSDFHTDRVQVIDPGMVIFMKLHGGECTSWCCNYGHWIYKMLDIPVVQFQVVAQIVTLLTRFNAVVLSWSSYSIRTVLGAKVEKSQSIDRRIFADFMAGVDPNLLPNWDSLKSALGKLIAQSLAPLSLNPVASLIKGVVPECSVYPHPPLRTFKGLCYGTIISDSVGISGSLGEEVKCPGCPPNESSGLVVAQGHYMIWSPRRLTWGSRNMGLNSLKGEFESVSWPAFRELTNHYP